MAASTRLSRAKTCAFAIEFTTACAHFGFCCVVVLMHDDDAAGVIEPDIRDEPQHLANVVHLRDRIERVGDDKTLDRVVGERGRHVRRRHHEQLDLALRCVGVALGDRREAGLTQQHLEHGVVNRVPERHGHGLPGQFLDGVDLEAGGEGGAAVVVPGDEFEREFLTESQPDRHGHEDVDHIHLLRLEGLGQR